jgi:hypothetical protein
LLAQSSANVAIFLSNFFPLINKKRQRESERERKKKKSHVDKTNTKKFSILDLIKLKLNILT